MEIQTNINTSVTKEKKVKKGAGTTDSAADGQGKDVVDTADYKVNSAGKKYKAHRIIFNKGVDDGKKGVSEHMELQEKEMTDAQMKKREEIVKGMKKSYKDFKSRYGANAKSVMYATATKQAMKEDLEIEEEIQEELKGNQHKLDKNKNGKLDKQDFKMLRKEEAEHLAEAIDPNDYKATSEKSQFGGHRPHVVNKSTGKTMMLGQHSYKSPEHAKAHAQAYLSAYGRNGMHAADRAGHDYAKLNKDKQVTRKEETELEEGWDDMMKASKERGQSVASKSSTMTKHDVKKTSTGTVYTKQRDADGMSKEFKRDNSAPMKRGRGRPKKSSFGEAVEFLMGLDEEAFDSIMEDGFDAFMEHYEQLDELSRDTLLSYANKVSLDSQKHSKDPTKRSGEKASRSVTGYAKAHNRLEKPVK